MTSSILNIPNNHIHYGNLNRNTNFVKNVYWEISEIVLTSHWVLEESCSFSIFVTWKKKNQYLTWKIIKRRTSILHNILYVIQERFFKWTNVFALPFDLFFLVFKSSYFLGKSQNWIFVVVYDNESPVNIYLTSYAKLVFSIRYCYQYFAWTWLAPDRERHICLHLFMFSCFFC